MTQRGGGHMSEAVSGEDHQRERTHDNQWACNRSQDFGPGPWTQRFVKAVRQQDAERGAEGNCAPLQAERLDGLKCLGERPGVPTGVPKIEGGAE